MNKFLVYVFATLLGTLGTFGTLHGQLPPMRVGASGGIAITDFVGDASVEFNSISSAFFGVDLLFHNDGAILGGRSGVHFVTKGATFTEDGEDRTIKISYAEIPLLLNIAYDLPNSAIRPALQVGGSVGIKYDCKFAVASQDLDIEIECEENGGGVRPVDAGVSVGATIDLSLAGRYLVTPGVRYIRGLTSTFEDEEGVDVSNSAIQVGATLRLLN